MKQFKVTAEIIQQHFIKTASRMVPYSAQILRACVFLTRISSEKNENYLEIVGLLCGAKMITGVGPSENLKKILHL